MRRELGDDSRKGKHGRKKARGRRQALKAARIVVRLHVERGNACTESEEFWEYFSADTKSAEREVTRWKAPIQAKCIANESDGSNLSENE